MTTDVCQQLAQATMNTPVKRLILNGEEIVDVYKFVRYDKVTGLAYFTMESTSIVVAICEKIDLLEFGDTESA